MGLTADQQKSLNRIESEMARKGFALGDVLAPLFATSEADILALQKGVLDGTSLETSDVDAAALDLGVLLSNIESAGIETRTLAAPAAGEIKLKMIVMTVDGGNVTVLAENVLGFTVQDFTFDAIGDTTILLGVNQKWVIIGGSVTPA